MVGLVRAESPDDELVTYEWATEVQFDGSVHVDADTVSLVIESGGELWERSLKRTRDLHSDLTKCLEAVEVLRAAATHVDAPLAVELPTAEPIIYDHRDIAAG